MSFFRRSSNLHTWLFKEDVPCRNPISTPLLPSTTVVVHDLLQVFVQETYETLNFLKYLSGTKPYHIFMFLLESYQKKTSSLEISNKYFNPNSKMYILHLISYKEKDVVEKARDYLRQNIIPMYIQSEEYQKQHPKMNIHYLHDLLQNKRAGFYFFFFLVEKRYQYVELYIWLYIEHFIKKKRGDRRGVGEIVEKLQQTSIIYKNNVNDFEQIQDDMYHHIMEKRTWYYEFIQSAMYQELCHDPQNNNTSEDEIFHLQSILRKPKWPDGIQVHSHNSQLKSMTRDNDGALTAILTFNVLQNNDMKIDVFGIKEKEKRELKGCIEPFLIPDGKYTISNEEEHKCLFLFVQQGTTNCRYGACYYTYKEDDDGDTEKHASGVCFLSHSPVLLHLQHTLRNYILNDINAPETALLVQSQIPLVDDLSLRPLFEALSVPLILQVIGALLLEHRIVLVSSSYSLLTIVAESLKSLIYPFPWCHIYAPVLPKSLLSHLHCPTPFLVGIHSTYACREVLPECNHEKHVPLLLVDLERQVLEGSSTQHLQWKNVGLSLDQPETGLPLAFQQARVTLQAVVSPCLENFRDGLVQPKTIEYTSTIRTIFLDLMKKLQNGISHSSFIVGDMNESVVLFDTDKYLSLHSEEERPFLKAMMNTQGFSEMINSQQLF